MSQGATNLALSIELFPPRDENAMRALQGQVTEMMALNAEYFSVTYGAGGSTRQRTVETVDWLRGQQLCVAPHLACIGSAETEIVTLLDHYKQQDIRHLVALRGDLPSGLGLPTPGVEFRYASQLVAFVRERYESHFHIMVAAYPEYHPQSSTPQQDMQHFLEKVAAGANSAITQYFYNVDAYFAFVDRCQKKGVTIPIIPGIMPITNHSKLARFSDMCGAEIPRWIRKRLESFGDDIKSIQAFGHDVVVAMCDRLREQGAPGFHFYSMNQASSVCAIWRDLGLQATS